jgi:hypothetical protein
LSLSSSSTETTPSAPLDKENRSGMARSALSNSQQESSESSATFQRKNHSSRRGNVTFHSSALPPLDRSHLKPTNHHAAQHEFSFDLTSPLRDRKMADDTTAEGTAPTANHSFSSASDHSLNTTSSSLEEHLIELMSSSMSERQGDEAQVRSDCINPVAWTLLRSGNGDEDSPFVIKENWSYIEENDSCSRGTTLSGKRPSSSPCLVRALPPSNAKRPRAQRASLATFSVRSPSNLAFRPSFSPGF